MSSPLDRLCAMMNKVRARENQDINAYGNLLAVAREAGFSEHSDMGHFLDIQARGGAAFNKGMLTKLINKHCKV